MSLVISLVVSLCSNLSTADINKRVEELKRQHPDARVSVRVSKSCVK